MIGSPCPRAGPRLHGSWRRPAGQFKYARYQRNVVSTRREAPEGVAETPLAAPAHAEDSQCSTSGAGEVRVPYVDGIPIGRPSTSYNLFWQFAHWLHVDWFNQINDGLGNLPLDRGVFIIASNHQSHLDTSALCIAARQAGVKKIFALGARDYFFKNAFKRWFVTKYMNVLPISRKGINQKDIDTLQQLLAIGSKDYPVALIIYPEGTRSTHGHLQPFKPGVGYIAATLNVPVVPAFVKGTRESLPKARIVPVRKQLYVEFGQPMEPRPDICSLSSAEDLASKTGHKRAAVTFAQDLSRAVVTLQAAVEERIKWAKDQNTAARRALWGSLKSSYLVVATGRQISLISAVFCIILSALSYVLHNMGNIWIWLKDAASASSSKVAQ